MATLTITKSYADTQVFFESDLDDMKDSIEAFVNTTKLNDDNFQNSAITGSTKLADSSVKAANIRDGSITSALINATAVTTAKLQAAGIATANIADSAVDETLIAAAGLNRAALAALNAAESSTALTTSTTSTSIPASPLTGSTLSITSKNGNPVLLFVSGTVGISSASPTTSAVNHLEGGIALYVNGTQTYMERLLNSVWVGASTTIEATWVGGCICFAHETTAGQSYTFGLNIVSSSGQTMSLTGVKLYGFELLNGNT